MPTRAWSHGRNTNQIVRNGMLYGWFDNVGAPVTLGCPVNSDYAYKGGAGQDTCAASRRQSQWS
jgi:hypothetical protein